MSIRNKLRRQSGASLFLAILFFLVCMTVGGAILAAATVSAGRLRDQRQTQQDYLTVSSAARLLQEELGGVKFTGVKTTTETTGVKPSTSYKKSLTGLSEDNALGAAVLSDAATVYPDPSTSSPAQAVFTVAAAQFDTVTGTLDMNDQYALTLTFCIEESAEGAGRSPMTLTLPAMKNTTTTRHVTTSEDKEGNITETVTTIETTTVTWENGAITKGIAKGAST